MTNDHPYLTKRERKRAQLKLQFAVVLLFMVTFVFAALAVVHAV